jgi:hypothetical protein
MKPQLTAPELTYTRQFEFKKGTHKISAIFQPYCTGMYCALTDSEASQLLQLNFQHKEIKQWVAKLTKKLNKDGYTSTATEGKLTDFLKVEDIETYILPYFIKKPKIN